MASSRDSTERDLDEETALVDRAAAAAAAVAGRVVAQHGDDPGVRRVRALDVGLARPQQLARDARAGVVDPRDLSTTRHNHGTHRHDTTRPDARGEDVVW